MPEGSQLSLKLTPGEILIVAGAVVALIFSFFDFFSPPAGASGTSAWGDGLLPVATIIVVFCVIMGLQVALSKLANVELGTGIAGFTWVQVHLALGFFALLQSLAFVAVKKGDSGIGVGLILMLIGSGACFVGAILLSKERSGSSA